MGKESLLAELHALQKEFMEKRDVCRVRENEATSVNDVRIDRLMDTEELDHLPHTEAKEYRTWMKVVEYRRRTNDWLRLFYIGQDFGPQNAHVPPSAYPSTFWGPFSYGVLLSRSVLLRFGILSRGSNHHQFRAYRLSGLYKERQKRICGGMSG